MKQNILIATLLAGMLALAGCGGGGSSSSEPPPPPEAATSVSLEDVTADVMVMKFGLTENGQKSDPITIEAGESSDDYHGITFSCPAGDTDCVATFENRLGKLVVMSTGGLTAKDTPTPDPTPPDLTAGTTPRPTESTDPLSNDVLLKALKDTRTGADETVWNVSNAVINTSSDVHYTPLSGPKITLRIGGTADAYWGRWVKSTEGTLDPDDRVMGDRGIVWGGSTPYGKKPDGDLPLATYTDGDGADDALFYYSTTGKADDWKEGMGNFSLTANFKTGMVGGNIGIANTVITGSKVDGDAASDENITLMPTAIDGSGTFSGTAKFADADVTRQNGSWNGGFFGDTTMVTSGVQGHKAPGHAAGKFSVSRAAVGTSTDPDATQSALHIRGAFGGAKEK